MKKQLLGFVLLCLISGLMPLDAPAQIIFTFLENRSGKPGDEFTIGFGAIEKITGPIFESPPVVGLAVTFSVSPDDGTVSLSTASTTTTSSDLSQKKFAEIPKEL